MRTYAPRAAMAWCAVHAIWKRALLPLEVYANPAWLDDPKRAVHILPFSDSQKFFQPVQHTAGARTRSKVQDDDAGASIWRKAQHLAEIAVKRYVNPALAGADFENRFIWSPGKLLPQNRRDLMSTPGQELAAA